MRAASYFILTLLLLTYGCKKKSYPEPVNTVESPFYLKLALDGKPLEINAGKDDYNMFSSISRDSSDVYSLVGEFKQNFCTNCPNSIRIQINDSKETTKADPVNINSVLFTGYYPFLAGNNDVGYSVNFKGISNKAGSSYYWSFGDSTFSYEINPTHIYKAGNYKVILIVVGPDNSISTITGPVSVNAGNDLNAFISASTLSTTVTFSANIVSGKAPYTYLWDFGDGRGSDIANPVHTYSLAGSYNVKLTVSDSFKSSTQFYNIVTGNDISDCAGNFSFSKAVYTGKRLGLSKTIISYTDANGVIYTSDNALQPKQSYFLITSIEDFVSDITNKPVKKVKLKFNCKLFNGKSSITLDGSEVVLGLTSN
jgi:hypothetical protein